MKGWRIFTAYTPEYTQEMYALRQSLSKLSIPLDSFPYVSTGDWMRNCALTVEKTMAALDWLYPSPVVWLDSDARVLQKPTLFDDIPPSVDIGVHKRCNKSGGGYHYNSGTIYWANNGKTMAFLRDQAERLFAYRTTRAGVYPYMDYMLTETEHDLEIYELPLEYSFIEGTEQPEEQIPFGRVVILHTQASRRLSKVVRDGCNNERTEETGLVD